MKIVRGRTPQFLQLIVEKVLPDTDGVQTSEDYILRIVAGLQNEPENIFLLAAVEEEELEVKTRGFIIAVNFPDYPYVLISQCWIDAHFHRLSDIFFMRVLNWTHEHGKTEIRMETSRDKAGFERKWGFKEISRTMSLDIGADFEIKLIEALGRKFFQGDSNGQEQRTKVGEHPDEGSTDSGENAGGLRNATAGTASEVVPGTDSAESSGRLSGHPGDVEQSDYESTRQPEPVPEAVEPASDGKDTKQPDGGGE